MNNLKPWRLIFSILLFAVLVGASFLVDLKVSQPVREVEIQSLDIIEDETGPIVSFDLVNKGLEYQEIGDMTISLNNLWGVTLDEVKIGELVGIEGNNKRHIELAWGDTVGSKGWLWTRINLEEKPAHQQLSWYWPKVDFSSPMSLLAFSPVVLWLAIKRSFFT